MTRIVVMKGAKSSEKTVLPDEPHILSMPGGSEIKIKLYADSILEKYKWDSQSGEKGLPWTSAKEHWVYSTDISDEDLEELKSSYFNMGTP